MTEPPQELDAMLDEAAAAIAEFRTKTGRADRPVTKDDVYLWAKYLQAKETDPDDPTDIKERLMTDTTTTEPAGVALAGAAPYDPAEELDRVGTEAFRKLAAGLRRTADALAHSGFAELREAAAGLVEAAEAADVIASIVGGGDPTDEENTE
jgi:hypothetical protein